MKKISIIFFISFIFLSFSFAQTSTETPTITKTKTETITPTLTETPTITSTPTITPTFTNSPTPQASVFAYPNPAAFRDNIFIAYPSKTGKAEDIKRVVITVYSINGDYVAQIVDDAPNGYTEFKIDKLARGTYLYKVLVRYNDGTEEIHKYKKFAIIK
ncbi:MAG: T9SS type A sorting domain-containing protein [Candidatus Goldbacteria bacterium]|nr:T9SS type A sorting domain-containing protein [Candidatus Goldiibacteriota bacterium]